MRTAVRIITLALVFALTATACGGDSTPPKTAPDAIRVPPADAIDVTIGEVELANDELTVRGEKPTPCNDLGSIVSPGQDVIEVEIWAEPTDEVCIQVVEPFEISFDLPDVDADTAILVNGREVGRIDG